jgi:membrane protease YdiL (CAAX protease family)
MTDPNPPTESWLTLRRLSVPWGITDAMIGFAIVACGSLASLLALGLLLGSLERQADGVTVLVLFLLQVLMIGTVWLLAVKWRGAGLSSLGLWTSGLRWPKIVGWAALALGLSIVAGLVYQVIVTSLGIDSLEPSPVPERLLGEGVLRAFTVGILVVVGPAAEEIFFRGFLLSAFVQGFGVLPGMIVASAIFAVAHGDLTVLLPTFASGAILSWLYLRTRSIWPGFLAHAGQNSLAVTFAV